MNYNNLINIIQLLRPKYYNIITRLLIGLATVLMTQPLWVDVVNILLDKIQIRQIGEHNLIIGFCVIVIALIYNTIHKFLDLKYKDTSKPAYQKITKENYSTFSSFCQALLPIIKDNEYIFKHCGPNSGSAETEALRTDLTLWHELRKKSIIPNNRMIGTLIKQNKTLIPSQFTDIFNKLLLHIQAFETHVNNNEFDYSEYQFPKEITNIIANECYNSTLSNKKLKRIKKWLSRKITTLYPKEVYLIGSILLYPNNAKDVDIVLISDDTIQNKVKIDQLVFDFKVKFKLTLHITLFDPTDNIKYTKFINKNNLKHKII